jgi:hypothetical protein
MRNSLAKNILDFFLEILFGKFIGKFSPFFSVKTWSVAEEQALEQAASIFKKNYKKNYIKYKKYIKLQKITKNYKKLQKLQINLKSSHVLDSLTGI